MQVPTNLDNVYFNANSGFSTGNNIITIDQTIVYCNNMDWTGAPSNPTILTTLSTNTIKIFGSLTLINAMTFSYSADLSFEATTPGKTITSNGVILPCEHIYFNGAGGSWTLTDSLTAIKTITHNSGIFNTNNKNITVGGYSSWTSNPCSLLLGSSRFKINPTGGGNGANLTFGGSTFTFNAGTSVIQFIGNNQGHLWCPGFTFYDLITSSTSDFILSSFGSSNVRFRKAWLLGNSSITGGSPTFDSLVFSPGKTYILESIINITTNGSLVANGTCSLPINIRSRYSNTKAYIAKSGNAVNVNYVTLRDIGTSGGAVFNAITSFDLGNISGWNITNPSSRNLFWIGGTGLWSDPLHWSVSSGGPANSGCIPMLNDNVFFDANSGFTAGSSVTMDMQQGFCHDLNWTGALNTPEFKGIATSTFSIGGSLTFIQNMIYNFYGNVTFNSTQTGNTITSANKVFKSSYVTFDGNGGSWILQDSLSGTTLTTLDLNAGNINTNNQNINIGAFNSQASATLVNPIKILSLTGSRVTITGDQRSWQIMTTNFTLNAGTSTIIFSNTAPKSFLTDKAYNYYNVTFLYSNNEVHARGSFFHKLNLFSSTYIGGNNQYDSLVLTNGNVYKFESGSTHTFLNGTLVANGTCSAPIYIQSFTNQTFSFIKNSGTILVNYILIRNNAASGGASFIANNSFATPEVTGWTINTVTSRNLYWVGGNGSWNDANHWSLSSGGAPGGGCIPGPNDNVFFDANSFPSTNATVTASGGRIFCNNMDWTGSLNTPTFYLSTPIEIFGYLTYIGAMNVTNALGSNYLFGTKNNVTVATAGHALAAVTFNGTNGTWNLQGDLQCVMVYLLSGTLRTNDFDITTTINGFNSGGGNARAIYLGNSTLNLIGDFFVYNDNLVFDAGTSTIIFNNGQLSPIKLWTGGQGGLNFHNVIGKHPSKPLELIGNCYYNKVTFLGPGNITSNCTFDTLKLTPGRTYYFNADSTQTITPNGTFDAMGTPGFPIEILSTTVGIKTNISKTTGTICLDYLFLKDINATGGAQFYAGVNGANVSNNSGWIFSACPATTINESEIREEFIMYPIPVHGSFFIDKEEISNLTVYIIDATGRKMKEVRLSETHTEINLEELSTGIYNVVLTDGKKITTKKITVY